MDVDPLKFHQLLQTIMNFNAAFFPCELFLALIYLKEVMILRPETMKLIFLIRIILLRIILLSHHSTFVDLRVRDDLESLRKIPIISMLRQWINYSKMQCLWIIDFILAGQASERINFILRCHLIWLTQEWF